MNDDDAIFKMVFGVLGALVSSGLLAYILGAARKFAETRNKKRIQLGLENIRAGKQVMREMLSVDNVTRVMLFNGHDSGGVPDLGRPFYATLIDYAMSPDFAGTAEDYDNFRVDSGYIEMLLQIMADGVSDMRLHQMREGILKRLYVTHGVKHSRLYYIGSLRDRLVYYSVASHYREFTDSEIMRLDVLADKMRTVFRNRY